MVGMGPRMVPINRFIGYFCDGMEIHRCLILPFRTLQVRLVTLPETNSEFTPENGWLECHRFLLGRQKAYFSEALAVSFRECKCPTLEETMSLPGI